MEVFDGTRIIKLEKWTRSTFVIELSLSADLIYIAFVQVTAELHYHRCLVLRTPHTLTSPNDVHHSANFKHEIYSLSERPFAETGLRFAKGHKRVIAKLCSRIIFIPLTYIFNYASHMTTLEPWRLQLVMWMPSSILTYLTSNFGLYFASIFRQETLFSRTTTTQYTEPVSYLNTQRERLYTLCCAQPKVQTFYNRKYLVQDQ